MKGMEAWNIVSPILAKLLDATNYEIAAKVYLTVYMALRDFDKEKKEAKEFVK